MLSEYTWHSLKNSSFSHYQVTYFPVSKRSSLEDYSLKTYAILCLSHMFTQSDIRGLSRGMCVFRRSIFMKCAAFLVADLLGCQSLNYNKMERVSKNQSEEIEILGAQGMSLAGDCACFAGAVAQIMLPFSF